jgi:hypothetical protein
MQAGQEETMGCFVLWLRSLRSSLRASQWQMRNLSKVMRRPWLPWRPISWRMVSWKLCCSMSPLYKLKLRGEVWSHSLILNSHTWECTWADRLISLADRWPDSKDRAKEHLHRNDRVQKHLIGSSIWYSPVLYARIAGEVRQTHCRGLKTSLKAGDPHCALHPDCEGVLRFIVAIIRRRDPSDMPMQHVRQRV